MLTLNGGLITLNYKAWIWLQGFNLTPICLNAHMESVHCSLRLGRNSSDDSSDAVVSGRSNQMTQLCFFTRPLMYEKKICLPYSVNMFLPHPFLLFIGD